MSHFINYNKKSRGFEIYNFINLFHYFLRIIITILLAFELCNVKTLNLSPTNEKIVFSIHNFFIFP